MSRERTLESADLRVAFAPLGDRYTQRIELRQSDASLVAVDDPAEVGQTTEAWPLSPPLQDVHLEVRPDGMRLALMVGLAGLSHWSISCELQPSAGELDFDVACRIKEPALWLGSTYELSPSLRYEGDRFSGEILQGEKCVSRLIATKPAEIHWDSERSRLQIRPHLEGAEAPSAGESRFPQTIRWRYKVQVPRGRK